MPIDAPDWIQWTQTIEIIASLPVPVQASTEVPISRIGDVSDSTQSYVTVLTYTVPAAKEAILYGLELYSDNWSKTRWRLTIKGTQQWADVELPVSLNMVFSEARLAAGLVILLEGKSSDGTAVRMWGHLEGKEVS